MLIIGTLKYKNHPTITGVRLLVTDLYNLYQELDEHYPGWESFHYGNGLTILSSESPYLTEYLLSNKGQEITND